jgi:hypothetical protein
MIYQLALSDQAASFALLALGLLDGYSQQEEYHILM